MEPISVSAVIAIVTYLSGKAFDKAFDTASGEFTKDSIKWLKSVLFKDNKPKEVYECFIEKPQSIPRQKALEAAFETELEDNPLSKNILMEIAAAIQSRSVDKTLVQESKNVNTGSINSQGQVILGDNNTLK